MNGNDYYGDMIERDDLEDLIEKLEELKEEDSGELNIPEALYTIATEINRLRTWLASR